MSADGGGIGLWCAVVATQDPAYGDDRTLAARPTARAKRIMLDQLAQHVAALLGSNCLRQRVALGELTVVVPPEAILSVLKSLRDDPQCQFEQLVDVCGVDYPEREKRFDVV